MFPGVTPSLCRSPKAYLWYLWSAVVNRERKRGQQVIFPGVLIPSGLQNCSLDDGKGIRPVKGAAHPQRFSSGTSWWRKLTGNWLTEVHLVNNHQPQPFYDPFFQDHPCEPVPAENFWTLWCKGRLTEADTPTIQLGATPSGLISAHLHQTPIFTGRMPFLPPNRQSTEGN